MPIYLSDIPLPEAQARLQAALQQAGLWRVLGSEEIPLDEQALGRVLSAPVWARISAPQHHAAAMDGFALRAAATHAALPSRPLRLEVGEGVVYVDTGDPLPEWADAVVPVELAEALDEQGKPADAPRAAAAIRLREALPPWTHIRPVGEDVVATELVLPAGTVLRAVDLGAAAAAGHSVLRVAIRPKVAVLPTGSELVPVGQPVERGRLIEYNSIMLAAQVREWGGAPQRYPITPDSLPALRAVLRTAAETADLILLNAGSSAGSEDYSARVIAELGEVLVHGVAVRPGHPVILGMLQQNARVVPVIGVPGYPVSAALTGEIFVEPLLARWLGRALAQPLEIEAALTRKITSPAGDDDYVRVVVGRVGARLLAAPLARGAGMITSLARADGVVILPRGVQGAPAGAPVRVRLYRSPAQIDNTIFMIGSHDMTLDLLAQYLAQRGRRLVSANAGSQGGLLALRRAEAHLAGAHLLDPLTGQYNRTALQQYLPDTPVQLTAWVGRVQGLLVAPGNPLRIHDLRDLARPEVHFINRQRGAGTRVLLDHHLQRLGIAAAQVNGYENEVYTHMAVAAAVASGRASCGLGVMAAARALDLDFVPLFSEQYDLVMPCQHLSGGVSGNLLAPLLDLMNDHVFRAAVQALPGYEVARMGEVVVQCQRNTID